ncbi:MAG: peptidoglycan DD-metalloendopeptidase family protein [Candidatus Heimdallarchaeota archaeon]|nr:peptidoglycan DD-metalloendopeptidase family protein [Candidatus Heimdallarchaeota archaeon]
MNRRNKILLTIFIPLIIIVSGIGGFILWSNWPAEWSREAPVLDFPVANIAVIHLIGGYGNVPWGGFHNGIDFCCNVSVNILAPCDVRVTEIRTWMYATDPPDRWQTSVQFKTTWGYTLSIAFESWALNETYADIQRDTVPLQVNQKVSRGEVLGQLLYHGDGCHIHFMMKHNGEAICPYPLFSSTAKAIFDLLFAVCGVGGVPCNETAS